MRRRWKKTVFSLIILAIGVFGAVLVEDNVYAEDDGSGGWNTGSYFEVSVTKTTETCETEYAGGGGYVGDDGYIVGGDGSGTATSKCTTSEGGTETLKIVSNGTDSYTIDGRGSKIVNGVTFSKLGNGNLQVMVRGATTFTTDSMTIENKDSFADFWKAASWDLNNNELHQWNDTYSFRASEIKFDNYEELTNSGETDNSNPDGPAATCINSGGLGTLGWVLCPALDIMNSAVDGMYNLFLKPALQVDPQLFTDKGAATRDGWTVFRNIANVLFIVLLLVVIFSQLTGVGIDNYGVKKILPKIILAAVLINLSYWICIVFVDLSNILGNAFQAMFDGLAGSGNYSIDLTGIGGGVIGVSGAVIFVGILAAIMAGGYAVFSNPAIMATLVISALGVGIAILFLFILLAAREAAIVVLVVLSPLAVACYMLPNTKSMFDKWLKFFQGLLLVYPIAGLLIGGGNYISSLLLNIGQGDSGPFAAFTAMIVGIVPIFFIPTVLRGAFAAMGNIGARISGLGQRASGAFQGAARNSNMYRNMQDIGAARRARLQAGYDRNGNRLAGLENPDDNSALARFRRGIRGGRRSVERANMQHRRNVMEQGARDATWGADYTLQAETANAMEQLTATGAINDMGDLQSRLTKALEDNDRAMIRAITDALSAKGDNGRDAVKAAFNDAVAGGNMGGAAAKTFADNLMANHAADYKNNNRAMFEVARGINSGNGPVQTTDQYLNNGGQAKLAGKATAGTMGNMDDEAFREVFGDGLIPSALMGNDSDSVEARAAIGATAYAALHDQNANIKADRRAALEKLVLASGYQPKAQEVVVIPHNGTGGGTA